MLADECLPHLGQGWPAFRRDVGRVALPTEHFHPTLGHPGAMPRALAVKNSVTMYACPPCQRHEFCSPGGAQRACVSSRSLSSFSVLPRTSSSSIKSVLSAMVWSFSRSLPGAGRGSASRPLKGNFPRPRQPAASSLFQVPNPGPAMQPLFRGAWNDGRCRFPDSDRVTAVTRIILDFTSNRL